MKRASTKSLECLFKSTFTIVKFRKPTTTHIIYENTAYPSGSPCRTRRVRHIGPDGYDIQYYNVNSSREFDELTLNYP